MKTLLRVAFALGAICLTVASARALPICAPMDFDGDCKSDILWRHSTTGQDYLWLMNGLTTASQGYLTTIDDPAWLIAGIGDFDGDGKADILWRNTLTGENYLWLMNGLTVAARGLVNFVDDPAWQIQGVGDFDGDGRADILWRNTKTGENYMYLMNGWTIVARGLVNLIDDQAWQVKGIGDFDGDGRADILWRNTKTGENYMYLMNGWTIVARGLVNFIDDQAWQVKGIGDFDGDGKADILWRNAVTGENYMYLMNGWTIAARGLVNYVDPSSGWDVKAIGDFDGDGKADILWRQVATGEDYAYFMNGWTIGARGFLDAAPDVSWMPRSALTVADRAGPDTLAPSTPTGVTAAAVSTSQINLSWNAAADNVGVIRYRVYRNGAQLADVSSTSYSNTGLAAAKTYSYTVAAYDAARNLSAQSSSASATTKAPPDTQAPSTPASLVAAVISASQVDLSWSASSDNIGVTGYRVYRDGALTASPSGTIVSITGLSASMLYSFTVSAFDAAGNVSAPSAPLSVTTQALADTAAPSTPAGLTASAVTPISLTLSWRPATDNVGVTGYRVYRDGMLVASPTSTSVPITELSASTLYSFTVSAFDAAGNASAPSAPLPVTTQAPGDTSAPAAPTGLTASAVTAISLTLSWSAATDDVGVTGYRVYRDGTLVASPSSTSVPITGLLASTLYSLTVSAVDAAGNASALSAPLSATTATPPDTAAPSTPAGLIASALTPTSLTLSWSAATDNVGVTGYRVYRGGTLVASPTGTSVSIAGLLASTLYSFSVSAFDATGNASAPSAPLAVTTPMPPPPAPAPEILWRADMETGDLSEWDEKVNSGSAESWAVTAASAGIPPKRGNWVMKQSVTGTSGGTRMTRYPEIDALTKSGTTFYMSWWEYYPAKLVASGSPDSFMFSNFQVLSQNNCTACWHPIWGVFVHPTNFTLILAWSPNGMAPAEGPHAGETGKRAYFSTRPVPVGQWVFFEAMITPAADFSGALKLWMNGEVLFDLANVKTRFPDVGIGGRQWTALDAYGSYTNPIPATHYVDDVTISLGRLPYAP